MCTYWLTRDQSLDGKLDNVVDVWLARPHMCRLDDEGNGMVWVCEDVTIKTAQGDMPARYAQWTIEQCIRACGSYPQTELECMRVG